MPRPIRILLQPHPLPGADGAAFLVRGCTVGLQVWSSGSSLAKVGSPSPAEIRFQATCLKDALDTSASQTLDLGSVTGQITLLPSGVPQFSIESVPPQENRQTPSSANSVNLLRVLDLSFRETEFSSVPPPVSLFLDDADLKGFRHVELSATLNVGGAPEAASTVNDVLDVPLKLEFLSLTLLDEVGDPLKSQGVTLTYPNDEVALTTDATGQVRVQNPPGGAAAVLGFSDEPALRKELKSRWSKPRNKPALRASRSVEVLSLTDVIDQDLALEPGARTVSVQPRVELARFVGLFFDTSKTFLLPSAQAELGKLQPLYDAHPNSTLLVVGHTDRAGDSAYNDVLSLDRASAIAAYLADDASGFTKWYAQSVPKEKRWGDHEDQLMLHSLTDGASLFATGDAVQAFRTTRNVSETGPVGPVTRQALVTEYMAQDGATLPTSISVVTHGCGENFPEVQTADGVAEEENRRVELFFFDTGFGVQPAPAGNNSKAGSTDYPEWRRRARQTHDFDLRQGESTLVRLTLLDSEHEPLAGMKWSVLHEFGTETGETDANGKLAARIPARVQSAVLVHDFGAVDLTLLLLPPVAELLGAQKRLANLGYDCETDGTLGPDTQDALEQFQEDQGLPATGALDQATQDQLQQVYGQ
jgi:outer membrane protein OmpA-like peptidoglycan-associated protein